MAAFLVLAALALGAGQETPEDAFKKVEAAIEGARTLRVTFTIDAANADALPGKGSFSIGEGGRVSLSVGLKSRDGRQINVSEECDGSRIVSSFEGNRVEGLYQPKHGRSNYNVYLSRIGIFLGLFAMHGFRAESARRDGSAWSVDLKQIFQVANVKWGEGRKGMSGLVYELKSAIEPMPVDQVKIWYDPNSYKIARREYRVKGKGLEETIIEDYLNVQLGDDKAAEKAATPAAPVSDAEMDNLFFKAKLQVAETQLRSGNKAKAAELIEDLIKTYPQHAQIGDAKRLLDEAKKK